MDKLQTVIALEDIKKGEELVLWSLAGDDTTYIERGDKYPHMMKSGIACRDFTTAEELSEVDILLCQLKIQVAKDE